MKERAQRCRAFTRHIVSTDAGLSRSGAVRSWLQYDEHMSKRRAWPTLLVVVSLSACGDNLLPEPEPLTESQRLWREDARPVLDTLCTVCHNKAEHGYAFLAGSDDEEVRETLLVSDVVDVGAPATSLLLTKGEHEGPYLTNEQSAAILGWLDAERAGL